MPAFTVAMNNATVGADRTLAIIHTDSTENSAGSSIILLRAWANQIGTETSDQLGIQVAIKASAFGTYTSTTPVSHWPGGASSGIVGGTAGAEGTAGTNASAEGAGSVTTLWQEGFNNVVGWLWVPVPEERIIVPRDTAVILKLIGTPSVLTGWCAGIVYAELT